MVLNAGYSKINQMTPLTSQEYTIYWEESDIINIIKSIGIYHVPGTILSNLQVLTQFNLIKILWVG